MTDQPSGALARILDRARQDASFRERLVADPLAVAAEHGLSPAERRWLVLPNFGWVVEGRLAGVARPGAPAGLEALRDAGVRLLLNLGETPLPAEWLAGAGLRAVDVPVPDLTAPTPAQLDLATATIASSLAAGEAVAVCCGAGLGRTGTVLAAYLVRLGRTAEAAIAEVRARRPGSVETAAQEAAVGAYAASRRSGDSGAHTPAATGEDDAPAAAAGGAGRRYATCGFLYDGASRRIVLHHRGPGAPVLPGVWSFFCGGSEPEDGGDPAATWRRELREELGIALPPERVRPLRVYPSPVTGRPRHVLYAEWTPADGPFTVGEGDGCGWFTLDQALRLPDLPEMAKADLRLASERLGWGAPPEGGAADAGAGAGAPAGEGAGGGPESKAGAGAAVGAGEEPPPRVWRRLEERVPSPELIAFGAQFLEPKRAEVVMVVRDRQGAIWLHRKGHWRLPTGNLRTGEGPVKGVLREVREELGAPLPLVRPLGVLELDVGGGGQRTGAAPLVAHFFLLDGGDHVPGPVPEEGIDAWRAVPVAELPRWGARLRELRPNAEPGGWMRPHWGAFRALELDLAAELLVATGAGATGAGATGAGATGGRVARSPGASV